MSDDWKQTISFDDLGGKLVALPPPLLATTPRAPRPIAPRVPLRNPRIAGNAPDPYASIAEPISTPADDDPYAAIATPISPAASAPPRRQPLRNPRIAGNEPDPFAAIAQPISAPSNGVPKTLADTTPMADPGAGKTYQEPETKGPLHQIGGFLQGAGENIAGAVEGVHNLFQEPQNDDEKAIQQKLMVGQHGELGGRMALAGYRFLHGVGDTLNQMDTAGKAGAKEAKESGSTKAGILTDLENEPFVGGATKLAEQGEYGKALGDLMTSIALMRGGTTSARELEEAGATAAMEKTGAHLPFTKMPLYAPTSEASRTAIPAAPVIAGTTLPETVGQAAARANPAGIGTDIKGLEDVAKKIPGSKALRNVSTAQQTGAREILANKAAEATGAQTSPAPEAVEQNARNATEAARQAGNAKYQAIGEVAQGADLTKTVEAAQSILEDEATMKVLPKGAREALGKLAGSMADRETLARQLYNGRSFSELDPSPTVDMPGGQGVKPRTILGERANVLKMLRDQGLETGETTGIDAALKARSELGAAANAARDPADARLLHLAHEQMGQAVNDTLADLDKTNGTDHVAALKDADKTWTQKFAFENFTEELQKIMEGREHSNNREINGAEFQRLINQLDPRGARPGTTSQLQRMFPDDPQSVQDLHDLADFMGRNQAMAGGLASGMAKIRMLGGSGKALMLIANNVGFSYLLSKPGMARAILTALTAGKNVAKASAAIGEINHAANQAIQNKPAPPSVVPPGRVAVSTPKGIYHFPNQQAADAFKFSAGIQ